MQMKSQYAILADSLIVANCDSKIANICYDFDIFGRLLIFGDNTEIGATAGAKGQLDGAMTIDYSAGGMINPSTQ